MQRMLEQVLGLSREARDMLTEFARSVREKLGERVKVIELFGSRARGDAHEESDFDVPVVVDERDADTFYAVCDVAFDAAFERGFLLVPIVMSEDHWQHHLHLDTLLSRDIVSEGALL